MSDRIAAQVARHFLAKVLQDTGEESFYGGPSYMMNVTKDRFVHFTYESRAQEILDSGALLANPPYKKFGYRGRTGSLRYLGEAHFGRSVFPPQGQRGSGSYCV